QHSIPREAPALPHIRHAALTQAAGQPCTPGKAARRSLRSQPACPCAAEASAHEYALPPEPSPCAPPASHRNRPAESLPEDPRYWSGATRETGTSSNRLRAVSRKKAGKSAQSSDRLGSAAAGTNQSTPR